MKVILCQAKLRHDSPNFSPELPSKSAKCLSTWNTLNMARSASSSFLTFFCVQGNLQANLCVLCVCMHVLSDHKYTKLMHTWRHVQKHTYTSCIHMYTAYQIRVISQIVEVHQSVMHGSNNECCLDILQKIMVEHVCSLSVHTVHTHHLS